MAKTKKEDTPQYKEQAEEFSKDKGDTETITVGREGQNQEEIHLNEIILTQTDLWYKTQLMQLMIDTEKLLEDMKIDLEKVKNEISRK